MYNINMYYEQVGHVLSALSQALLTFLSLGFLFWLHFFEWPLGIKPLHCHIAILHIVVRIIHPVILTSSQALWPSCCDAK